MTYEYDDCEMPEFFSERIPKARKEHSCCECHKKIRIGMVYWNFTAKWDGAVQTFRQHIECRDACFMTQELGYCIPFGDLRSFIRDRIYDYQEDRPKRPLTDEFVIKQRKLLAQGIRASRLKTKEQIAAYNIRHKGRTA